MKIALVNLGRTGGGPLYALKMARRLAERCELLSVISRQAYNAEEWRASGLHVQEVDTYTGWATFIQGTFDLRRHWRISRMLSSFQPDAMYYPMFHPWYPLINLLNPGVPSVLTLHDPVLHEGEENVVIDTLQKLAVRQAERIIVLSRAFVEVLAARGVPPESVDVVPLGEMSYYDAIGPVAEPPQSRGPTLLFLGRILPYKGIDTLLEAYPRIRAAVPDARLLIVGGGDVGPYRSALDGLAGVTVVNRWIDDDEVAGFFRQTDVVVVPYRSATQSLAVVAAYAFSKPVVATAVGGIPEQVIAGTTGLLIPPSRPDLLAEACVALLKDSVRAGEMGRAGYEMASTKWNWGSLAEQVVQSCAFAAAGRRALRRPAPGTRSQSE